MGKRISIYLFGLAVAALGIALVILSGAGAGPWDLIVVGLNNHMPLTIGIWSIISQAMVVLLTAFIEKARPQYGSVVAILIRSAFLDLWVYVVLKNIDFAANFASQWITLVMGVIFLGTGIGIYVEAKFPKAPIDGLMVALHNRFGWKLSTSRMVIELSAVVIGTLLGGPLGLGTMVVALMLGRIIQFSNKRVQWILARSGTAGLVKAS